MEVAHQTKLKFDGITFPQVEFKTTGNNPLTDAVNIEYKVVPSVYYPPDETQFFIFIDVELSAEDAFFMFVRSVAKFSFDTTITEDMKKSFINVNAPAIAFPYLRAFISNISVNVGCILPIILPAQFFKGDLPTATIEEE